MTPFKIVLDPPCVLSPHVGVASKANLENVGGARDRLAAAVRELRLRRGWSQVDLAERSGVSRDTVKRIETGQGDVWLSVAEVITRALRMPAKVLSWVVKGE